MLAAIRDGFNSFTLPPNDDGSTGAVDIGFDVNFFGNVHSKLFVNNNGNVTFDEPLDDYTPVKIKDIPREIIAPFWADVDTRNPASGVVTYGTGTVAGRDAFGVNWIDVGYFSEHVNHLNSFQLVIAERSDVSSDAFDVEFNYDRIEWETGDADGGVNGLGGSSARAGISNGSSLPGTYYELIASAQNGGFLDVNLHTSLASNSLGSNIAGRYIFEVRNGTALDDLGLIGQRFELENGDVFLGEGIHPDELRLLRPTNANAADTTNTDQIQPGGLSGLNLTGAGLTVGVWEPPDPENLPGNVGHVLGTHQELAGRVVIADVGSLIPSRHATHVAATIAGVGVRPAAQGMATAATIRSYTAAGDISEMGTDAVLIVTSNHSYGFDSGWSTRAAIAGFPANADVWLADRDAFFLEDPAFGKYSGESAALDRVLFENPNLLTVWAAGNERNDAFTNALGTNSYVTFRSTVPGWVLVTNAGGTVAPPADGNGGSGHDTLTRGGPTSKNAVVVGAIRDITADPKPVLVNGDLAPFSSWGPTDDGRVKPDLIGNGVSVFSAGVANDTDYIPLSGTSMATPNVTGTATLLVEHYMNLVGAAPRSATTKGVMIHTATDGGTPGPDYNYGWGVLDAAEAASFLTEWQIPSIGKTHMLFERTLTGGTVDSVSFTVSSGGPLIATIVWTDPAGASNAGGLDDRTRALVNDLDLVVVGPSGTSLPWTLDPANPTAAAVRNARNAVDNVEQVLIDAPVSGSYTINISHTGTLAGGLQDFTLLLSGRSALAELPVPTRVSLDPSFGDETVRFGSLTNGFPRLFISADIINFVDTDLDGIVNGTELPILAPVAITPAPFVGTPTGVAVEVFHNGTSIGFATDLGSGTLFEFTPLLPLAGININDGNLHVFTAAVRVFDGTATPPVSQRSELSRPLNVITDEAPKLGVWGGGSVYLDLNGDEQFGNPNNLDVVHTLGLVTDHIFNGVFSSGADFIPGTPDDGSANGFGFFDRLAAYGRVGGRYRWLIDFTNDGVPDNIFNEPATFNGLGIPVAGNFNGNVFDDDEIGLFTGTHWILDTNRNFSLADEIPILSEIRGLPVVGDFDGDGNDDLATYDPITNTFFVSISPATGPNARLTYSFRLGNGAPFLGVRERPVAADMNGDGVDDLGLWVPDRSGILPGSAAEWYFIVSAAGAPLQSRIVKDLTTGRDVINFRPKPFGNDLFYQFGDEYSLPLVGNFDPPGVGDSSASSRLTATNNQVVQQPAVTQNLAPVVSFPLGTRTILENASESEIDLSKVFFDSDPMTYQIILNSNHGLANSQIVGNILRVKPVRDGSGETRLTIQARDTQGTVAQDVLTLRVIPLNRAPVSITPVQAYRIDEDSESLNLALPAFFVDPDGDQLSYSVRVVSTSESIVEATIRDAVLYLTPKENRHGTVTLRLTATDNSGATADSLIAIEVLSVNDAPVLFRPLPRVELPEDAGKFSVALDAYFADFDGDRLFFEALTNGNPDLIAFDVIDGVAMLTPRLNQNGQTSVSVRAMDSSGASVDATFDVFIRPINDGPVATSDTILSTFNDEVITPLNLETLFTDVDDSVLSYRVLPGHNESIASASVVGNQLILAVSGHVAGSTRVRVEATDAEGLSAIHEVLLNSIVRNSAPVVDRFSVPSLFSLTDASQTIDVSQWFTHPLGDTLRFAVDSQGLPDVTLSIAGNHFTITPMIEKRSSGTIVVTATDSTGASAVVSVPVEVVPVEVSQRSLPTPAPSPLFVTTPTPPPLAVEPIEQVATPSSSAVPLASVVLTPFVPKPVPATAAAPKPVPLASLTPTTTVPPKTSISPSPPVVPTPPSVVVNLPDDTLVTPMPVQKHGDAVPPRRFSARSFSAR